MITIQELEKEFNGFKDVNDTATLEHTRKCDYAFNLDTKINTQIIGMKKTDWESLGKSYTVKVASTASAYKDFKVGDLKIVSGKGSLLAYLADGNLPLANSFSSAASERRNAGKEKGVKVEVDCLTACTKYIDSHIKDLSVGDTNALISILQVKLHDKEKAAKENEKMLLLSTMTTEEIISKLGLKVPAVSPLNPISEGRI